MTEFLARLKRRKLVQWALAYVAFAFALLQGVDIVAQRFTWPASIERLLILLLAIGFFVVLVLAWYHGERGTQRVGGTELLIIALLLAIGGALVWRFQRAAPPASTSASVANAVPATLRPAAAPASGIPAKSVAVLPFANMSPGKDDAYFADGLSEEIINALTRVPDLHVVARTSSFAFRNADDTVPLIAAKLRVATVLEGSVRRAGNHLRITAQLIRASDGFDLWSEDYDRSGDDIIAIQEDVAKSIAEALKTTTDPKALAAMQRAGTQSVPAYDAYLRGLAIYTQARNTGDYDLLREAAVAFEQTVDIDPDFADAYAKLANVEEFEVDPTDQQSERPLDRPYGERMATLRQYLDAAITHARDDTDREKYRAFRAMVDLRLAEALRLAQDYTRRRPNDPYGLDRATWLALMTGDLPLARRFAAAIAQRVGPLGSVSTPMQYMLWARDVPRATQMARQALALHPDSVDIIYQAHRVLLTAGAIKEAAALVPRLGATGLPANMRLMVRMRQACAEGRTADAEQMFRDAALGNQFAVLGTKWQELLLLGHTGEAWRLLDRFDTSDKLYALATFSLYPMFDARRYPRLLAVLKTQGIQPLPPQPEPYGCKPATRPTASGGKP
jgi:TolB-like protein